MDCGGPTTNKDKLLVIMGATGAGKSRLSLDLTACFPPATFEVINADKMQVYKGLDITTNKLPVPERLGVPHHLLGEFDSLDGEVTPAKFRELAAQAVSGVISRRKVPVLVGGSNSFIHALVVDLFEPGFNVFDGDSVTVSISSELRYNCCFLWVDVSLVVLTEYLSKRVDEMLDGDAAELAEFYNSVEDDSVVRTGIRKSIGVASSAGILGSTRRREVARRWGTMTRYEEKHTGRNEKTGIGGRRFGKERVVGPSVKIVNHFLEE
ncbi:hypothetical protein M0R45_014536 [Rubus argutus]|uniref:Adenylate isopentenyltransferase n=1 Tax=Rubus argutus TaxID=59490 RepID=A0AAW1XN56_RUBAR